MSDRLRRIAVFFGAAGFAFWIVSSLMLDGRGPGVREAFVYPLIAVAALLALLSIAWRKKEDGQ